MWRRVVLVAGLVVVVACGDDDAAEVSSATSDVTATTGAATTELPTPTDDPSGEESSWVLLDDFESGSLEGWQVAAVNGGWNAYGDEQTLASFPPAPPQGGFAAATAPTGPGTRILYRDVSLEGEMTLHLSVFYESEAPISTPGTLGHDSAEPNQQFRVDLVDPAAPFDSVADGDVLLDVFATEPGDPLSLEPTEVAIDVAEIAGRTVRLRIAQVDNQGPMSAGVDNIRFESTGVDVSIGLPDTPAAHRLSDPGALAASREADPSELLATFEESMPEFLSQASVPGAAIRGDPQRRGGRHRGLRLRRRRGIDRRDADDRLQRGIDLQDHRRLGRHDPGRARSDRSRRARGHLSHALRACPSRGSTRTA